MHSTKQERARRFTQIGVSQRIRLEWMEYTANLVLAGNAPPAIYEALNALLKDSVSVGGNARRSNREKTISILMKVWVRPLRDLQPLRREGLQLLLRLAPSDRIAVHWGIMMAVYPFWGAVASYVGRLLRLQGTVTAAQVQRRMRAQYGDRSTVQRAVQRVLRSFVDWGVLQDTSDPGVYVQGIQRAIDNPHLVAWMASAFLHAQPAGRGEWQTVLQATSLFPFQLAPLAAGYLVRVSEQLETLRHGLDQDLLLLRRG